MTPTTKLSVLIKLSQELVKCGSWCGETHIQKSAYLLQELLGVPLELEFILYKHGPFSFDLRGVLTSMRADGLLQVKPRGYYGPSLQATKTAEELVQRFPMTMKRYEAAISFVAKRLGSRGVTDLEQLATALYVTKELGNNVDNKKRIRLMTTLKPHITEEQAQKAFEEFDAIKTCSLAISRSS